MWDKLYDRLRGRATVAFMDSKVSSVTMNRLESNDKLPSMFYISKGTAYKYEEKLDIDSLENWVNERNYEEITDTNLVKKIPPMAGYI